MIVSHRYGFVFLKTRKTAGTSVELALRTILGPHDIATPLSRDEELMASAREIPGPRHYLHLLRDVEPGKVPDFFRSLGNNLRRGNGNNRIPILNPYRQHLNAYKARYKIGKPSWAQYFKFTIERNPWARTVSFYHWIGRHQKNPLSFTDFVTSGRGYLNESNYSIYSIHGIPVADYWIRYETLKQGLDYVADHLGLPINLGEAIDNIWAKSQSRERPPYTHYYNAATRRIVELQYANEIALMGYRFDEADNERN